MFHKIDYSLLNFWLKKKYIHCISEHDASCTGAMLREMRSELGDAFVYGFLTEQHGAVHWRNDKCVVRGRLRRRAEACCWHQADAIPTVTGRCGWWCWRQLFQRHVLDDYSRRNCRQHGHRTADVRLAGSRRLESESRSNQQLLQLLLCSV